MRDDGCLAKGTSSDFRDLEMISLMTEPVEKSALGTGLGNPFQISAATPGPSQ